MQLIHQNLCLSATDLVIFLGCTHATYLDLQYLNEPVEVSGPDEGAKLIQQKGIEHERNYLAVLKASGKGVVEIAAHGLSIADRAALTRAMGMDDILVV